MDEFATSIIEKEMSKVLQILDQTAPIINFGSYFGNSGYPTQQASYKTPKSKKKPPDEDEDDDKE